MRHGTDRLCLAIISYCSGKSNIQAPFLIRPAVETNDKTFSSERGLPFSLPHIVQAGLDFNRPAEAGDGGWRHIARNLSVLHRGVELSTPLPAADPIASRGSASGEIPWRSASACSATRSAMSSQCCLVARSRRSAHHQTDARQNDSGRRFLFHQG